MGAGSSKPEASAGSKHIFESNSPIQFSSNLVDGLQSNTETDSARAKSLELQIQARVSEELARLRAREQQTLAEIEKRLAEVKDTPSSSNTTTSPSLGYAPPAGSLDLDAPRIPFAGREYTPVPPAAAVETAVPVNRELSRESVNSDIEELRAKLEGRKKLADLDDGVLKAKADVVSCLRLNDRRPLDCWKEVQEFKREVARLEEAFVDRIVG
ncbi:altered inheritance of mitochondria protein 13, mitochondrial [Aspergillus pseudoustus]|uniref:Altered inheritance of mitochondria protein 13, mitochondrial n=1 Tax=Aspergillus pseudoustus TaxID=1810923 RepID=A0ABR4JQC5_9EURO